MHNEQQEEALGGGRLSRGVVRVGNTVRRPSSAGSDFTAKLLLHLQASGFSGAPAYLGHDAQGRHMLTYVEGWVPATFQHFSDAQVAGAGSLLRAFHDATRSSELVTGDNVVCHHDVGPNNVVFQNEVPIAFIDFDMSAPGPALDDVAYMAWTWCVSSKPTRAPATVQARQVRLLADAYGLLAKERTHILDAMLKCQDRNIQFWKDRLSAREGMPETSDAQITDRINWSIRERDYTESQRALLLGALR